MKKNNYWVYWRRALLLLTPAILFFLEIFHPTGFRGDVYHMLMPHRNWWFQLHMIQLPLLALMGVAIFALVEGIQNTAALVAKIAAWFFMVFYSAFDGIAGISVGAIIRNAAGWSKDQQAVAAQVAQALYHDPLVGGVHSFLSEYASLSWLVAAWAASIALLLVGKPRLPLVFLALSGIALWYSHTPPAGPIAFACFFFAALGLEIHRET